jgi:hypothetical protein
MRSTPNGSMDGRSLPLSLRSPERLGVEDHGVRAAESCVQRFVHELVRGRSLLAHNSHGALEIPGLERAGRVPLADPGVTEVT